MTGIGGFFELELPRGRESYHPRALALSSGRACLRRILEYLKPARVWVPFYICDAVLPAIAHAGAAVEFYGIDDALEPVLPIGRPSRGDAVLYVNYFGVKCAAAVSFAATHGQHAIVDDTQAFFQHGYAGAFSFNSARKFFGVPDGGYAYGDGLAATAEAASTTIRYEHLLTRWCGDQGRALQQYRESEACVTDTPVAMSAFAARLLSTIDYAEARRVREENFAHLHAKFGSMNRLSNRIDAPAGPFCYPLLLDQPVPWDKLWRREIFVPRLWVDVEQRSGAAQFEWERQLAERLLPLPIDQRYGIEDMDRVAAVVAEVLAW